MASAMLHTNDDFLNAIRAEPHERTLRLIYADWLDEHNDPRGELIRAEEEMRQVPVFADRFWELKPRRNELRTAAGTDWCALMKYGTECEPVFRHGIPDGWRERWRLIREFTERWHRVPMPDVGGRQSEIAVVETRLGRTLPPSVREWIAFAHDVQHIDRFPTWQWNVNALEVVPSHSAFAIWHFPGYDERFGQAYSALRYADLGSADPPVYTFREVYNNDLEQELIREDQPENMTLTSYALTQLPYYNHGDAGGFEVSVRDPADFGRAGSAELLEELNKAFTRSVRIETFSIYEMENFIVWLRSSGTSDTVSLIGTAAKPFARSQVATFLLDCARRGLFQSGIFVIEPDTPFDPISSALS